MLVDYVFCGNIHIIGKEDFHTKEEIKSCLTENGRFFVCETTVPGIYTFGVENIVEDIYGHKPGYVWSSRASVINKVFNMSLVDVFYKRADSCSYSSCAVDLDMLEQILQNSGYKYSVNIVDDETETKYCVCLEEQ